MEWRGTLAEKPKEGSAARLLRTCASHASLRACFCSLSSRGAPAPAVAVAVVGALATDVDVSTRSTALALAMAGARAAAVGGGGLFECRREAARSCWCAGLAAAGSAPSPFIALCTIGTSGHWA